MGLFFKRNPEEKFWSAVQKQEANITNPSSDVQKLVHNLHAQLEKYHSGLTLELSSMIEGKRELILSAEGIAENFPIVSKLVAAAPKLNDIIVIAFRPRHEGFAEIVIKFDGLDFEAKNLFFGYRIDGGFFDITIFNELYGDEDRNTFVNASYLLLDGALGEYDVAKGIRYIDFEGDLTGINRSDYFEFSELPGVFDNLKTELRYFDDKSLLKH